MAEQERESRESLAKEDLAPSVLAGAGGSADVSVGLVMLEMDDESKIRLLYCFYLYVPGLNEEELPKTKVNLFTLFRLRSTTRNSSKMCCSRWSILTLAIFARSLGLCFDVVSMRWGVLARLATNT